MSGFPPSRAMVTRATADTTGTDDAVVSPRRAETQRRGRAAAPPGRRSRRRRSTSRAGSRRSAMSAPRWPAARTSSPPTRDRSHSPTARWRRAAQRADRRFLFEGAVMDGVPIFNLVRETLPALNVLGFRGVVNSTTNFILTAMEDGQPFEAALAEMQARGIAEADASLDVDGWDAAAKTAALANVLLGANITPQGRRSARHRARHGPLAREARAAGTAVEAGGAGGAAGTAGHGARRAGGASRRRPAGRARGPTERAHPEDGSARGNRHRAARRQPDQTAYALLSDLSRRSRAASPPVRAGR